MTPPPDDDAPADARHDRLVGLLLAILGEPGAPDALRADAAGFLRARGLDPADVAALSAVPAHRLLLYRRLVRRNLDRAIRAEVPRTAARRGKAFAGDVERFVDAELPATPYVRDVAVAFVRWIEPRWREEPGVAPWLAELARHELSVFDAGGAFAGPRREAPVAGGPLALDARLRFHASVRLCRYGHAVHRLREELDARDEPAPTSTALVVHRDRDHDVRFLELTPVAAAIVERLLAGASVRQAVVEGAAAHGEPLGQALLEGVASLLADFGDRGILLGAETSTG